MSTGQRRRENDGEGGTREVQVVEAAPTRRTLVFPSVEVPRPRRAAAAPAVVPVPEARVSERPTLKTLPPVDAPSSGHGNTEVIELSASALDSDVSLVDLARDCDRDDETERGRGRGGALAGGRFRGVAMAMVSALASASSRRRAVVALAVIGLAVAIAGSPGVASSPGERATGVSAELHRPAHEAHEPASQHTPLAARAMPRAVSASPGACAALGAPRVLSDRAHLPPGLDVSVVDGGFGVGFASSADEALGLRLRLEPDGLPLRVADRVRVRGYAGTRMRHVAVEAPRNEAGDDEEVDVRVDGDESRAVVPARDAPAFRMSVNGGWIHLSTRGKGGGGRTLWPVPGGGAGRVGAGNGGFVRLGAAPVRGAKVATVAPTGELRVAAREAGGAVVALRTPSALWLGLVDAAHAPEGPLVAMTRPGAVLATPSVASYGGGGVVAWAEKQAGEREWMVMVATFSGPGEASEQRRSAPAIHAIAAGMSPAIAALPGGDLLLAYAVGAPGAHQVMVRRLGRDLEPHGEPVVVSPDAVNAGQPATAVAADGRALVAFFGAERGQPSSVLATPLSCSSLGL